MRRSALPVTVAVLAALLALAVSSAFATELNPPPVWRGTTLMGPSRGTAQMVKATVSFVAATKSVVFQLGSKSVQMTLGSTAAKVNGNAVTLTEAPRIIEGVSYVPLKTLLTGLGFNVHPDPNDSTAWIVCTDKVCQRLKVPPQP